MARVIVTGASAPYFRSLLTLLTTTFEEPVANLALLAACDHSVIANSTVSSWGAWLAEHRAPNPGERVVLVLADGAAGGRETT